jgi:hypothetical protein
MYGLARQVFVSVSSSGVALERLLLVGSASIFSRRGGSANGGGRARIPVNGVLSGSVRRLCIPIILKGLRRFQVLNTISC